MNLEQLLEIFGKEKGLGKLVPDSGGKCRLIINNRFVLSFEKSLQGNGFFLYGIVAELPAGREKKLTAMALEGNLFRKETGSASLGYHPNTRALVLFEHFEEADVEYSAFRDQFDTFLNYLAYWKNKIELEIKPCYEDISLDKHLLELQSNKDMKIFFA